MKYDTLEIGTEIYYTGDRANDPATGKIIAIHQPDKFTPIVAYDIALDNGNEYKRLPHIMFDPGTGRRFMLLSEYKEQRREALRLLEDSIKGAREAR